MSGKLKFTVVSSEICPENFILKINKLRKDNLFCDVSIKLPTETLNCHNIVLSAESVYFRRMFSCKGRNADEQLAILEKQDPEAMKKCIDYIYTGEALNVEEDEQENLFKVAHMMQLESFCKLILTTLVDNIDLHSFFLLKRLDKTYNLPHWGEKGDQFAKDNFVSVVSDDGFLEFDHDYIRYLIESKDTKGDGALKCKSLIKWAMFDREKREKHFFKLLKCIDFRQVPLDYHKSLIEGEPLIRETAECKEFVTQLLSSRSTWKRKDN